MIPSLWTVNDKNVVRQKCPFYLILKCANPNRKISENLERGREAPLNSIYSKKTNTKKYHNL